MSNILWFFFSFLTGKLSKLKIERKLEEKNKILLTQNGKQKQEFDFDDVLNFDQKSSTKVRSFVRSLVRQSKCIILFYFFFETGKGNSLHTFGKFIWNGKEYWCFIDWRKCEVCLKIFLYFGF